VARHINEAVDFVVMDGACKGAIELLEEQFPWMSGVVCSTHALDLLMEDIGKMEWAENVVRHAREFIQYMNSHHFTKAEFNQHSNVTLKAPNQTRFGTNYLMSSRLVRCRPAVQTTVCSERYTDWIKGLPADKRQAAR
jgi:hypothetical protein